MSDSSQIKYELERIASHIPGVRWIRILHTRGTTHPKYRFDAAYLKRDKHKDDSWGPISTAVLSISERTLSELNQGDIQFTVVYGENGALFFLRIGKGQTWFLTFMVHGEVSVDQTIRYFRDRDYLDHFVPLLGDDPV